MEKEWYKTAIEKAKSGRAMEYIRCFAQNVVVKLGGSIWTTWMQRAFDVVSLWDVGFSPYHSRRGKAITKIERIRP
jgi:hypothetical protein